MRKVKRNHSLGKNWGIAEKREGEEVCVTGKQKREPGERKWSVTQEDYWEDELEKIVSGDGHKNKYK